MSVPEPYLIFIWLKQKKFFTKISTYGKEIKLFWLKIYTPI